MAAHAVTGLTQLISDSYTMKDDQFFRQLRAALNLSCWTEDLEHQAWCDLDHYCDSYEKSSGGGYKGIVRDVAISALPFMVIKWNMLGFPATREGWRKATRDARNSAQDIYLQWEAETIRMIEKQSAPLPLPVTGVVSQNSLHIDMLYETVDLDWEEHLESCPNEDHDDCYESHEPTLLLGDWERDPASGQHTATYSSSEGYSAIFNTGTGYIQVVWSRRTKMCNKCSPCYPGQGDLDTPGDDFLAYNMPPEMWRENE